MAIDALWYGREGGSVTFGRLDIPATGCRYRVIPIIPHHGGDYKYQFMACGRSGHSTSKSFKQALLQSMWTHSRAAGAETITLESLERERAAYREVYYGQEGLTAPPSDTIYTEEQYKEKKNAVDEARAKSGITNAPCLFDSVAFNYWVPAFLHLMLGVVNGTKDCIDEKVAELFEEWSQQVLLLG